MSKFLIPLIVVTSLMAGGLTRERPVSPLPSDEFLLDTARLLQPVAGLQNNAYATFDGTNYLVLWTDSREEARTVVYGARVTQDGTVLDAGFRVLQRFTAAPSSAAFGSGCFLTAGAVTFYNGLEYISWIDAARVMPDGTAPDVGGFQVSTIYDQTNQLPSPIVVFADTTFLVTWKRPSGGWIDGAFVASDGSGSGSLDITAPSGMVSYSIAYGNDTFLIAYQMQGSYNDIMGIRLGPDALPIDTVPFVISDAPRDQKSPSVAYDGTDFIVTWQDARNGTDSSEVYACRVTRSADVLDSNGIRVSFGGSDSAPTVAATAERSLISWRHAGDTLLSARVSAGGVLLDSTPIQLCRFPSAQKNIGCAAGQENFIAVWSDARGDGGEVFLNLVDTSGAILDSSGILVTQSAAPQSHPAVGGNRLGYFAAWQDDTRRRIYGSRVSPEGAVLDFPPLAISATTGVQSSPAVTEYGSGAGFLVAWQNSPSTIFATRITTDGQVLDTQGIAVSASGASLPAVAWNGSCALVVYRKDTAVHGNRVSASGELLDSAAITIGTGTYGVDPPAVASDGQNFLVAWSTSWDYTSDIYGTRIGPDGAVLDTPYALVSGSYWQFQPCLTFGGQYFLLAEQDGRNSDEHWPNPYEAFDIYFVRIFQSGVVRPLIPLQEDTRFQQTPAVTFDGERFVMVWATTPSSESKLQGSWLDTSGAGAESLPHVVHDDGDQFTPALAHGPGHQILIVYNGWANVVDGVSYGTSRIWGKLVELSGINEEGYPEVRRYLSSVMAEPNPARSRVAISCVLAKPQALGLCIFDCSGRIIHREVRNAGARGTNRFIWNGEDSRGRAVPSGAYFYVLRAGTDETATGRLVLLR